MKKFFCDRCKKEQAGEDSLNRLEFIEKNIIYFLGNPGKLSEKVVMEKQLCSQCLTDLINLIDYECDNYKFKYIVTNSREEN